MSGSGSQPTSPRLATLAAQESQDGTPHSWDSVARTSPSPKPQTSVAHQSPRKASREDRVQNERLLAEVARLQNQLAISQQAAVPIEEANLVVQRRKEALAHQAQQEMLERETKLKQHAEEIFRQAEQEAQLTLEAERHRNRVLQQEGEFRQRHYEQVQRSALEAQASAQAAQEAQRRYAAELAHIQASMALGPQSTQSLDLARMHQSFPMGASLPTLPAQVLTHGFSAASFQTEPMPTSNLPPSFPHLVSPSLAAGQGPHGNGYAFPAYPVSQPYISQALQRSSWPGSSYVAPALATGGPPQQAYASTTMSREHAAFLLEQAKKEVEDSLVSKLVKHLGKINNSHSGSKISKFHAATNKLQQAISWISRVANVASEEGWFEEDIDLLPKLQPCLDDQSYDWMQLLPMEKRMSHQWTAFRAAWLERFGISNQMAIRELSDRKQGPNEDARSYIEGVKSLCTASGINCEDAMTRSRLISGFHAALRYRLELDMSLPIAEQTFEYIAQRAVDLEKLLKIYEGESLEFSAPLDKKASRSQSERSHGSQKGHPASAGGATTPQHPPSLPPYPIYGPTHHAPPAAVPAPVQRYEAPHAPVGYPTRPPDGRQANPGKGQGGGQPSSVDSHHEGNPRGPHFNSHSQGSATGGTSGGKEAQGAVPMDIGMIRPEAYGQMSSVQPYAGTARVSALEVVSSPCKAVKPSHGTPARSTDGQEIREKLLKADFTTEQAEAPHDIDPQIWKAFLGECGMTVGDSVFYPSMFFQEKMAKDLLNAVYPTVAYITTPPPSWASQGDISKPGFNLTNDLEEALVSNRKRMRKVDRPFFLGKLWTSEDLWWRMLALELKPWELKGNNISMLLEKWWMPHMFSSCLVTGRGDLSSTDTSSTPQVSTADSVEVAKKRTHRPEEVVVIEDKSCSDSDVSIGVPPLPPQRLLGLDPEATQHESPYNDLQASSSKADDPDWEHSLKPPATLLAEQDVRSIPIGDKGTQWHVDLLGPLQLGSGENVMWSWPLTALPSIRRQRRSRLRRQARSKISSFGMWSAGTMFVKWSQTMAQNLRETLTPCALTLVSYGSQTSPHHIPSFMVKERMKKSQARLAHAVQRSPINLAIYDTKSASELQRHDTLQFGCLPS